MSRRAHQSSVIVALLMSLAAGSAYISVAEQLTSEVVLCGDIVPSELRQANATFLLVYELDTDVAGRVTRVTRARNDVLPDAGLVACLQRWRLPVADAKVTVSMTWEHAKGWTQLAVSMPGHPTRRMTIQPGWPF